MNFLNEQNPSQEKPDFHLTHIILGVEILFNPNIDNLARKIFGLMWFMDGGQNTRGCFASNKYFAEIFEVSEARISQSINMLKKDGLIFQKSFDGRRRILRVNKNYIETHAHIRDKFYKRMSDLSANGNSLKKQTLDTLKSDLNISNGCLKKIEQKNSGYTNDPAALEPPKTKSIKQRDEYNSFLPLVKNLYYPGQSPGTDILSLSCLQTVEEYQPMNWRRNKPPVIQEQPSEIKKNKIQKDIKINSIDKDIKDIISFWEINGFSKIDPKWKNVVMSQIKALLNGTYFPDKDGYSETKHNRAYSKEEIIESIRNFEKACFNPEYQPSDPKTKSKMRTVPISYWLYNENIKRGQKSKFIQNLKCPQLVNNLEVEEDLHPECTNALKKVYIRHALGGIEPIKGWTYMEENQFRKGANQMYDWFAKNKRKLRLNRECTPMEMANLVISCISADKGEIMQGVTPGWLSSPTTFNRRLPNYLNEQALIIT